jgi:hypothetical protein
MGGSSTMIKILNNTKQTDSFTGVTTQTVHIRIGDGITDYLWHVGGIPTGLTSTQIQTQLEMREADLLAQAQATGTPVTTAMRLEQDATEQIASISDWATWDADTAAAWINANVTNVDSAKLVLVRIVQMLVALRNKVFPHISAGE